MKLVNLTAADVEKVRKALETQTAQTAPLHHEQLSVDGMAFGLVRLAATTDPRTNTYSVAFRAQDRDYQFIVRPTHYGVPSITLNVVQREPKDGGTAVFASYTVLKDTVTKVGGDVPGVPGAPAGGNGEEMSLASPEFQRLLGGLKVE